MSPMSTKAKGRHISCVWSRIGGFRLNLLIALLSMLWLTPNASANGGSSEDQFLEKFQRARGEIKTFLADFVQKKHFSLFDEEKTSTGKILFKAPYQMIWKYQSPDKTQMRVTNKAVSFYFPDLEQIEVYKTGGGKGSSSFFFIFEATANELKENFSISGPADFDGLKRVEMAPKTEPLVSEVKHVTLWLSEPDYLPRKVLITEINGDTTEITFSNIKINQPINDKELQFDAPEGTKVFEEDSGI